MDDQNFIQFKKKRDLGLIISDAIKFLQIEWKPFFLTILKTSIIPILIAICGMVYYIKSFTTYAVNMTQVDPDNFSGLNFYSLLLPMLVFFLCYLLAYASITVSSLSYIKSYTSNKGIVNFDEVSNTLKRKFWPCLGLFFLNFIIIFCGMLFCFLPAIYFGVVLSVSFCLLIFQNKSVTDSFGDSFNFIKNHWWETFGIILVVSIIIWIISFIVGLPASLYQSTDLSSIFQQSQDPNELFKIFEDPIYLTLLAFSYFAGFILYAVTKVVAVFIYYDIKEQKNPSTDIIDEIGVE